MVPNRTKVLAQLFYVVEFGLGVIVSHEFCTLMAIGDRMANRTANELHDTFVPELDVAGNGRLE